jgi:CheY-like chemotaxis protein
MACAAAANAKEFNRVVSEPGPLPNSAAEMAGAVAHDFNNVLTVISGNLALAERHAAGNPKLIRLLENIRIAAERAASLTSQLMKVSARHAPDNAAASAPGTVPPTQPETQEKRRKVLVVEDDPDVAEVAVAVIESLGHEVEMCPEAGSALARVEQARNFDLVFSDIVMPGMNGIELAEAIQKIFPNLPVLLATGYSNAALAPGALRFPVLAKPYSVQELSRRIGQMMEQETVVGKQLPVNGSSAV